MIERQVLVLMLSKIGRKNQKMISIPDNDWDDTVAAVTNPEEKNSSKDKDDVDRKS